MTTVRQAWRPDDCSPTISRWAELTHSDYAAWDRFARECNAPPDAFSAWARSLVVAHEMPLAELYLVRIVVCGATHAVWPVRDRVIRRLGVRVRILEPLLNAYSLHHPLLTDLEPHWATRALIDTLDQHFQGWNLLRIDRLAEGDGMTNSWISSAQACGFVVDAKHGNSPPFLPIDCGWDDYLRRQSKKFRSNIGREARNLAKAGEVRVEHVTDAAGIQPAFESLAKVESSSWKSHEGTSLAARPWEQEFYKRLTTEFAESGQVLLSVLCLDGLPIAHDLMLTGGGKAYGLKSSFDERYRKFSPGSVLEAAVIRWVFEAGLTEYDFLGKNESYKMAWTGSVRRDVNLTIFNRAGLVSRATRALDTVRKMITEFRATGASKD